MRVKEAPSTGGHSVTQSCVQTDNSTVGKKDAPLFMGVRLDAAAVPVQRALAKKLGTWLNFCHNTMQRHLKGTALAHQIPCYKMLCSVLVSD